MWLFKNFTWNHFLTFQVLRKLNNNPEVFHKSQRPIIEFSIENRKVLNAKQKRLEKSREKNPTYTKRQGQKSNQNKSNKKTLEIKAENTDENEASAETKPNFMGSVNKPGQKSLPTHTGPKIRHNRSISRKEIKRKEKIMKNPRKRKALQESIKAQKEDESSTSAASEPKKTKKAKKPKKTKAEVKDLKDDKKFSNMVQQYKQKLLAPNAAQKRKWFDD